VGMVVIEWSALMINNSLFNEYIISGVDEKLDPGYSSFPSSKFV
jgi:hypothetical protein